MPNYASNYTADAVSHSTEKHSEVREPRAVFKHASMPAALILDQRISDGARVTFAVLRAFAAGEPTCAPSKRQLCRIRGCHAVTLLRHLQELSSSGFLTIEQPPGKRSLYRLHEPECSPGLRLSVHAKMQGVLAAKTLPVHANLQGVLADCNIEYSSKVEKKSSYSRSSLLRLRRQLGPDYSDRLHSRLVASCRELSPTIPDEAIERLILGGIRHGMRSLGLLCVTVPESLAAQLAIEQADADAAREAERAAQCSPVTREPIDEEKLAERERQISEMCAAVPPAPVDPWHRLENLPGRRKVYQP